MNLPKRLTSRITLLDVAREAGVSRATASLVLRDSPLVAAETRRRVLETMEGMGYVYNRAAASLRTRRSGAVGVIVTEITNPFFAQMSMDCQGLFEAAGLVTLLSSTSENLVRQDQLLGKMHEYGVDGVLICPAVGTGVETVERLRRWQLPAVFVARSPAGAAADSISADNARGAELAVEHLIGHGHERIAFAGGVADSSSRQERLEGYRRALERHEVTIEQRLNLPSAVTQSGGRAAILELLAAPRPPTAVFCYNDVVACGVTAGLQSQGIHPGESFGVVGFDDIEVASTWQPPLTTVGVEAERIGTTAARLLLERMADPDLAVREIKLAPRLVVRESCGCTK
jgi:LacI family transcriptional regulator